MQVTVPSSFKGKLNGMLLIVIVLLRVREKMLISKCYQLCQTITLGPENLREKYFQKKKKQIIVFHWERHSVGETRTDSFRAID